MKLRDKKQIASDFQEQKKSQVDEGVRIAKNVDLLREELASLEKQRKDFLDGSKLELTKATGKLLERIEILKGEVKKLEERQAELRKPLDDAWATLEEEKALHAIAVKEFGIETDELSKKAKAIKKEEERIAKAKLALEEDERTIGRLNSDAKSLKEEAERINETAKREHAEQIQKFATANTELSKKQAQVDIDAKDNARVKKAQDLREKRLNDKERKIDDKYQTLLRTINRLNK